MLPTEALNTDAMRVLHLMTMSYQISPRDFRGLGMKEGLTALV